MAIWGIPPGDILEEMPVVTAMSTRLNHSWLVTKSCWLPVAYLMPFMMP